MSCQKERSAPRSLEVEGVPQKQCWTTTSTSCSPPPAAVHHHDNGIDRNGNDGTSSSNHRRKPTSTTRATVRYLSLSLLALILTLTCPGSTVSSSAQQVQYQNSNSNNSIPLLQCLVVYVLTLALFFYLLGSDPGYLTPENMNDFGLESATLLSQDDRNEDEDVEENHQDQQKQQQQQQQDNTACNEEGITMLTHSSAPSAASIRRPYCPTCQISPPLRAHHCKLCDRHVATFDHHCDFVATCIGERNHCRFWCFLLVQAIGFAVFCHTVNTSPWGLTTLLGIRSNMTTMDHVHWSLPLRVVLAKLYLYPLCFFAWIMVLLHTWMATTNSTTFEFTKGGGGGIGRREGYLEYLQGMQPSDLPFSKVRLLACFLCVCSFCVLL